MTMLLHWSDCCWFHSACLKQKVVMKETILRWNTFKDENTSNPRLTLERNVLLDSISLLHTEAVRKCKESWLSHLYANPEASGACLGSISGCKKMSTLTCYRGLPGHHSCLLVLRELCSRSNFPTEEKKKQLLGPSKEFRISVDVCFNMLSPIQSETPRSRGGQKAQGRLILHLKCKTRVIRQYRAQAVKDAPCDQAKSSI